MSFILDAIAKSERERQQQEVPDARILAVPVADTRRAKRIVSYLLLGALLLNLIVLLIWVRGNESTFDWFSQAQNSRLEAATVNQDSMSESVDSLNTTKEIEHPHPVVPVNQPIDFDSSIPLTTSIQPSIPDPIQQTGIPLATESSLAGTRVNTANVNDNTQVEEYVKRDVPGLKNMPKNGDSNSGMSFAVGSPATSQRVGDRESARQPGNPDVVEPDARKVFRLGDLPVDVRRDLPSVSFSGHLFSKNVNVSYVMVDGGRSVIAGQQIVDDVFLHEVTPNGAIVDFRGYLIEIGILQNWSLK